MGGEEGAGKKLGNAGGGGGVTALKQNQSQAGHRSERKKTKKSTLPRIRQKDRSLNEEKENTLGGSESSVLSELSGGGEKKVKTADVNKRGGIQPREKGLKVTMIKNRTNYLRDPGRGEKNGEKWTVRKGREKTT